jgi:uncharacterized membrane protein
MTIIDFVQSQRKFSALLVGVLALSTAYAMAVWFEVVSARDLFSSYATALVALVLGLMTSNAAQSWLTNRKDSESSSSTTSDDDGKRTSHEEKKVSSGTPEVVVKKDEGC